MKHKIEFYNCKKDIPLSLNLLVDDKYQISYEKIDVGKIMFNFNSHMEKELADEIMNDICDILVRQSYDHGVRWVILNKEHTVDELFFGTQFHNYTVEYRIRDAG